MVIRAQKGTQTPGSARTVPGHAPDGSLRHGNRGEATCRRLWERIPKAYRAGHCYDDFWEAYLGRPSRPSSTWRGRQRRRRDGPSYDGTIPCVSGWDPPYARARRFPSRRRCTRFVCGSFCTATIWRLSPTIEPLPDHIRHPTPTNHRSLIRDRPQHVNPRRPHRRNNSRDKAYDNRQR